MRTIALMTITLACLAGCASFEEAHHLDREFGVAQRASWNQQILHAEPQDMTAPEGLEGITAEEVMNVYNGTFAKEPAKVNTFEFGIEE